MSSTETVVTQEDQLVEQLTQPIIASFKAQKKAEARFNSRNRDSWKRMNRPHKQSQMESGTSKVYALLARFKA